MANLKLNSAIKGLRGRMDDWVYRKVGSKMIVSPVSDAPLPPPSAGQIEARNRFRTAVSYAKSAIGDPIKRLVYEIAAKAREIPIFAAAIGDFFKAPVVHVIDASAYHGAVGHKIKVLASDDIEVMSVQVAVRDAITNAILDQSLAVKLNDEWFFTAAVVVPAAKAVKIKATATDRPGNQGFLEKDHIT